MHSRVHQWMSFQSLPNEVVPANEFVWLCAASKAKYVNNSSCQKEQNGKGRDGKEYVIVLVKDVIFVCFPTIICLTVCIHHLLILFVGYCYVFVMFSCKYIEAYDT
jgi:hypothetical protein